MTICVVCVQLRERSGGKANEIEYLMVNFFYKIKKHVVYCFFSPCFCSVNFKYIVNALRSHEQRRRRAFIIIIIYMGSPRLNPGVKPDET